jgi:hypothetical protein
MRGGGVGWGVVGDTELDETRNELEGLWAERKMKLDLCLQLRIFEREALDVSMRGGGVGCGGEGDTELNESRNELEGLCAERKMKLDLCLQLRIFEKEALDVSMSGVVGGDTETQRNTE